MAMNIGEMRIGTISCASSDSGRMEGRLEWRATRTSSTTTVVEVSVYAKEKYSPITSSTTTLNYRMNGTAYINGTSCSLISAAGKYWDKDANKKINFVDIPSCIASLTITHGASGIENFNIQVAATVYIGPNSFSITLNTTTVTLNSGTLVKSIPGTTSTGDSGDDGITVESELLWYSEESNADNYSDVTVMLYYVMYANSTWAGSLESASDRDTWAGNISIDGTNYTYDYEREVTETLIGSNYSVPPRQRVPVFTKTHRVYHNADGTKTINISSNSSIKYYDGRTVNGTYRIYTRNNAVSANGTATLPTIPRAATLLTAPNFTDEDNPTITYSNPAGSSVTTLQAAISLDGTSAAIGWKSLSKTGTSYTFNLTDDERNTLRSAASDAASIKVWFLLKTDLGGNTFTEKAERTLSIVSCNPVLDSTVVDVNSVTTALTGDPNKLVKFYSNAQASLNVTLQKGSTLAYYEIKNGSNYGNAQVFTFNNVENNKFEFLARDSRGNIATKTVTPTMVEYVKLTCNLGSNTPDTSGNYDIRVTGNYFNGSFGAVSNTLTVQYRYKTESGSYGSWVTMTNSLSSGTYEATARITGLDYRAAYVVQVRATDKITTITSDERKVQTLPVFSWSDEDFEFNTDVRVTGDLRLKGDGNYGNTLYFGDGSYAFIREATDDDLFLHATDLTLEATNIYLQPSGQLQINGSTLPAMETGTWDAVLGSSAAVKSYTSRQGWYIKIGNVVTIGWNVDATCNSGYQSTAIKIAGAPYYPSVSASGGGILYGAYTTGGLAFEGWVIEESGGAITPRLQPCNNTSAANLNISSTAYYPNGGGNLKCFGSITYMTD